MSALDDAVKALRAVPGSRSQARAARRELDALRSAPSAHPMRARVVGLMADGDEWSPKKLAARLEASLPVVAYHVKVLADAEALKLVRTAPRRGAQEHFYRLAT